jgi:hypothetical protein
VAGTLVRSTYALIRVEMNTSAGIQEGDGLVTLYRYLNPPLPSSRRSCNTPRKSLGSGDILTDGALGLAGAMTRRRPAIRSISTCRDNPVLSDSRVKSRQSKVSCRLRQVALILDWSFSVSVWGHFPRAVHLTTKIPSELGPLQVWIVSQQGIY